MRILGSPARALAAALSASFAPWAHAHDVPLLWSKRVLGCEPPAVFYSPLHQAGRRPCCPVVEGFCPGGATCPQAGRCPDDGSICVPGPAAPRPNVMLVLSDDQGECHWGTAGECRSVQSGTPIPPPATPNLDVLAGYGTVFPIAHNTAAWCYPSINSLLTGRYARSYGGGGRIGDRLTTIPKALRGLDGDPGALPDPYNAGNRIGGYCTFLGGKLTSSIGDHGFDAVAKGRKLGRTACREGVNGGPPRCGSESTEAYDPASVLNMQEVFKFLDAMFVRVPGTVPAEFTVQHFFTWLAPRIPHQPLSAPPVIETYLFGGLESPALGGLFQLGQYCGGGVCPHVVDAFKESNFSNGRAYYANVWWADDLIRDLRKYLARASAPHCIDGTGRARWDVAGPADCPGTWASSVSPDLTRNTVILYLSDNGWFLPDSKHNFTENGYRTRLLVFDPRPLSTVPGWDPAHETPPAPNERFELGHSTDVLATIVGFALGTAGAQDCPMADDGTRCDGRDLRPYLAVGASGVPSSPLRYALCGHETKRPRSPTRLRYLLTRPGSVGRCVDLSAPPCASDTGCGAGATCVGGHCIASADPACASRSECVPGAACLGGRCRPAPSCIDDAACAELFPAGVFACLDQQKRWCRNAPGVACTSHADCPPCPAGPGPTAPPCGRVCEPRQLKLYVTPRGGVANVELTDLFLDPDEHGLHSGSEGTLTEQLSQPNGPYAGTIARLNCCIDDWWPEVAAEGSQCAGACPPDFACTE
jgi:hypothetical protein